MNYRTIICSLLLPASMLASAADIVKEAEEPDENLGWKIGNAGQESDVSNYKYLLGVDVHKENYARYAFTATEEGWYDLDVYYISCDTRWLDIRVNNGRPKLLRFDNHTPNWNGNPEGDKSGVGKMTTRVYCSQGSNTLEIRGIYGPDFPYTPYIDRFELTKVESDAAEEKAVSWSRECENYGSIVGNVKKIERAAFSGKSGIDMGADGGKVRYNYTVDQAGAYMLTLTYAKYGGKDLYMGVRVNRQNDYQIIKFDKEMDSEGSGDVEGQWLAHRSIILYLDEGYNSIVFEQIKTLAPYLDSFTLEKVDLSFDLPRPGEYPIMYQAAISDIAEWKSNGVDNMAMVHDHDEKTIVTIDKDSGFVLEFPVKVDVSGYALADADVSRLRMEVSEDGTSWETIPYSSELYYVIEKNENNPVVTYALTKDNIKTCKFIRFTATEDTYVGDIAVFGNLCEEMDNRISVQSYESTHPGYSGQELDKLFDLSSDAPYTVIENAVNEIEGTVLSNIWISVDFEVEQEVRSYLLATHYSGYYTSRTPDKWSLRAVDSNGNEQTIDEREGMRFGVPASTLVMTPAKTMPSKRYRLRLTDRKDKETHLSEFQLFTDNKLETEKPPLLGVDMTEASSQAIIHGGNQIIISTSSLVDYIVSTVSGAVVASGKCQGETSLELPVGLYIVKAGSQTVKVAIR